MNELITIYIITITSGKPSLSLLGEPFLRTCGRILKNDFRFHNLNVSHFYHFQFFFKYNFTTIPKFIKRCCPKKSCKNKSISIYLKQNEDGGEHWRKSKSQITTCLEKRWHQNNKGNVSYFKANIR